MIFITKNTCKHEGCTITAKYNLPSGKKTGKYCFTYKLIGMINVSAGVCVIENCTNPTAYGASSNNIPTRCYVHRQNEMFDVIHKSCEYTECHTRPMYNAPGNHVGRFCAIHKNDGMVHIQVYPCTSCGLDFRFREKKSKMTCVYCDTNSKMRSKRKEIM